MVLQVFDPLVEFLLHDGSCLVGPSQSTLIAGFETGLQECGESVIKVIIEGVLS